MMYWWGWGLGGLWWIMAIAMVFFWALVVGLVVWGVVALIRRDRRDHERRSLDDPMTILKRRYASGEITKEEYEEKKAALK